MRLSSRRAYLSVKEQILGKETSIHWAKQFFSLADFFRLTPRIASALVDSTRPLDARIKLFREVDPVAQLEEDVARSIERILGERIPQASDLAEISEELGLDIMVQQATDSSQLEQVTDQLFSIWQVLEEYPELRNALADKKGISLPQRRQMVAEIFADQLGELSLLLLERAIATTKYADTNQQHRVSISSQLRYYQHRLVEAKKSLLAVVSSAQPLSETQKSRLTTILQQRYQRPVYLQEQIDQALIGGVQIQIGAEIYDGSIATALKQTKEEIAS